MQETVARVEFIPRSDLGFALSASDSWLTQLRLANGIDALYGEAHHGHLIFYSGDTRPLLTRVNVVGHTATGKRVDAVLLRVERSGQVSTPAPRPLYVMYVVGDKGLMCTGVYESVTADGVAFVELLPWLAAADAFKRPSA